MCSELDCSELASMLQGYGVVVSWVPDGAQIPASYWGDREAGIRDRVLFLRGDTPVHSALHEASHIICAAASGRGSLDTDAGGEQIEEDAVCFLQIRLADRLAGFGKERALIDMDAWGYSFRLGKAKTWFEQDAEDACAWLEQHDIL